MCAGVPRAEVVREGRGDGRCVMSLLLGRYTKVRCWWSGVFMYLGIVLLHARVGTGGLYTQPVVRALVEGDGRL